MPWSNQSGGGGPWKGGGNNGGPWGGGGNNNGPWGGGPNRGGGNNPPDLEELLKRTQDRMRNVLPGGGGSLGFIGFLIVFGVVAIIWLFTGFYVVDEGEVGVELVLGKVEDQTPPGLNYNWPYPIGEVETPQVSLQRETTVGRECQQRRCRPGA
jgi:membrane protease subunit HflK